jgi:phosphoglycolate phosphatase
MRRNHTIGTAAPPADTAPRSARPTIVFDLDGTLVDTAPDLTDTLNVILRRNGLPAFAEEAARPLIGFGARRMIEGGFAAAGRSPADLDRMFEEFIACYADHVADRSRPFPGVEAALDALARRGCRLAVCTNKLEWLSVRLLGALGLARRFSAICGQDTFAVQKPHPDALMGTLHRAGGDRRWAVMVGDSATDIATARACGIPVIAVDFGYTAVPVTQFDPDVIISHFKDLEENIGALLGALPAPGAAGAPAPHPGVNQSKF